jgi:hypothetical protein
MDGNPAITVNTDASMDFNNRTISNLSAKDMAQSPLVRRWGCYQPAGGSVVTTVGKLDGCIGAHGPIAGGTNSTTFDASEGMIVNLQSAAIANVNVGLVSPTSGALCRTAFAGKAICRVKMCSTKGSRFYFGFTGVATLPISDTPAASGIPAVLVGFSTADRNWVIRRNDAAGAAQTTNIAGPVAKDTNWHTIEINWTDNATAINVIFDGVTQTALTTDIPANTADLWFNCVGQTSTSTTQTLLVHGVWTEFSK